MGVMTPLIRACVSVSVCECVCEGECECGCGCVSVTNARGNDLSMIKKSLTPSTYFPIVRIYVHVQFSLTNVFLFSSDIDSLTMPATATDLFLAKQCVRERELDGEKERDSVCVCVCVCV